MKNTVALILFAILVGACGAYFGLNSHNKKEAPPNIVETPNQQGLVKFINEKHNAEMDLLYKELHELKQIVAEKPEAKEHYITLSGKVTADSSDLYQKNMLKNLLTFHELQDPVPSLFDNTGSLLQQGNRRLINYLFERENVALRDNIIRVQDKIIVELKEQRSVDSAYNETLTFQLAHSDRQKADLSWQLSMLDEDLTDMTRKRNRWRNGGLAVAGGVTLGVFALK